MRRGFASHPLFGGQSCLLIVILACLLAACSREDDVEAGLPAGGLDYLTRLSRVLEAPLVLTARQSLPDYPDCAAELTPGEPLSIDLLEFFDLHRCDLGGLVGYRNSGLGRLQSASERWLYELQLLDGAARCDALAPDLVEQLQNRLPHTRRRALIGSADWRAFVSVDRALLERRDLSVDAGGLERALGTLSDLAGLSSLTQRAAADTRTRAHDALAELRFSQGLGRTRVLWQRQRRLHDAALAMLKAAEPLCRRGAPTPRGRIARTVLLERYVRPIQAQMTQLPLSGRGWLAAAQRLVAASEPSEIAKTCVLSGCKPSEPAESCVLSDCEPLEPTESCVLSDWHASIFGPQAESEAGRLAGLVTEHARAWQSLLRACGLEPGRAE